MKRKVFGIGLNKTGTTTLGECLTRLGYKHLGYRRDLLDALRQGRMDDVFAAVDQHESFSDWPYPLMYRELHGRYPDAVFILTTRSNPKVWIESLKNHSLHTDPAAHSRKLVYGYDYPHGFENEHIAIYESHSAGVKSFFARSGTSSRLLCASWESGDGWRELCGFLHERAPPEPFPHANERASESRFMADNMRLIRRQLQESNRNSAE